MTEKKGTGGQSTKGKARKSGHSVRKTSEDDLDYLYQLFYEIKVSEGRAINALKQNDEKFGYFTAF